MCGPVLLALLGSSVLGISGTVSAQTATTASAVKKAPAPGRQPHSSLPEEALKMAQEAERNLAANNPNEAKKILHNLDKQYPGHAAISLRLAEIYDTNNEYGPSLFYYRRYVKLAGSRAREIPVARVSTLELMTGIDDKAEEYAKTLNEQTIPVVTPTPRVERSLAVQAKDGSRVPLTSAEQLEEIQRTGIVKPVASPKVTVTPTARAIVLPDTIRTPVPPPAETSEGLAISQADTTPSPRRPVASPRVSVAATPAKPDEDNLFAEAFVKSGTGEEAPPEPAKEEATPLSVEQQLAQEQVPSVSAELTIPPPLKLPVQEEAKPTPARTQRTPAQLPRQNPNETPAVAYTQATPTTNSPRAANFFNVGVANGNHSSVVVINDLQSAVVTLSIVPPDDRDVVSAILAPGESKTLYVRPGTYDVNAKATSNDYSPITLMSTQFEYRFVTGRQYTRRFTQSNLQQVN